MNSIVTKSVKIDLVDSKTDRVIGDRYKRLAFDKVMRNRKERWYVGKTDSMTDITDLNDTSEIFSGQIQIILLLVIIIVGIIHTTYHFGNILESNFHLQNIVITLNFISLCSAATITHGNVKLNINYFDLLMYIIQVIITMIIFGIILWICIQIWSCINTRNFGKLHDKLNIRQFLNADKTDFYLQFMSNYITWSVYLGSIYDSPERIKITAQFVNGDVTLCNGCMFDYLTIQWDNINLSLHDLDLRFPLNHPVPLTSKFFFRTLFRNSSTLFKIIIYNPQNGKVKPLTPFYKLFPNEEHRRSGFN